MSKAENQKRWREKNREHISEYNRNYYASHGDELRAYRKEWRGTHRKRHSEYVSSWRRRRLDEAAASLGGACARCGETSHLHFHHMDQRTKIASPRLLVGSPRKVFDEEVAKCILLCQSCHNKAHRTTVEQNIAFTAVPIG